MPSVLFIVIHYLGHGSERRVFAEFLLTTGHLNTAEFKNSLMFSNYQRCKDMICNRHMGIIGLKVVFDFTER